MNERDVKRGHYDAEHKSIFENVIGDLRAKLIVLA